MCSLAYVPTCADDDELITMCMGLDSSTRDYFSDIIMYTMHTSADLFVLVIIYL